MNGVESNNNLQARYGMASGVPVQQVLKAAHDELLQLLEQRSEVMKRIGTVKQTIAGLANLFGDEALSEDLLELIDRKPNGRQPGFTKACRRVLMEAQRSLGAREVCAELERQVPAILSRHKDPLASVTTVLNRLVDYGEARSLTNDRGRRVWQWVSEGERDAAAGSARITA
jgi:chorismate mutase